MSSDGSDPSARFYAQVIACTSAATVSSASGQWKEELSSSRQIETERRSSSQTQLEIVQQISSISYLRSILASSSLEIKHETCRLHSYSTERGL